MYFLKGDLGWGHDINYHHDIKHWDFDNVSGLMERGFQNFAEFVLLG